MLGLLGTSTASGVGVVCKPGRCWLGLLLSPRGERSTIQYFVQLKFICLNCKVFTDTHVENYIKNFKTEGGGSIKSRF